ncbi:MAG: Holliday junction branch migration protein RuvA [Bacilli bacterium]|nr:Holliday junction branch migration protein RuvA [Bacilli bacterium]
MIYSLSGTIVDIFTDTVAIEVGPIGYEVFVSRIADFTLGAEAKLYTHEVITQDDHFLVGFTTKLEKDAFLSLITVKGIGPKTALAALSKTSPDELFAAIESSNTSYLKKLPGIGPKAAAQIILDLKGKLAMEEAGQKGKGQKANPELYDGVKAGLKALGFKTREIDDVLASINEPGIDEQTLLREALRKLKKH